MITKKILLFTALVLGVVSFGAYASGLLTTTCAVETAQTATPALLTSGADACCAAEGKTTTQNAMFKPTVQTAALAQSGSSCSAQAKTVAAGASCPAQTSTTTTKLTSLNKPAVQTVALATASGDACCADKESKTTAATKTKTTALQTN